MRQEDTAFFKVIPKQAQLTLQMLVPNKYPVIDTELLACLFVQHGLLKKCITDNLKEAADKVINNKMKQPSGNKQIHEIIELEISDECKVLIENFRYFYFMNKDRMTGEILTAYLSYVLVNDVRLKSHSFFQNFLYVKSKESVTEELLKIMRVVVGETLSVELQKYGEYLVNPLVKQTYDCFGRDDEIQDSLDILCRMKKSNVILVGNAGVGKTTVAKGICNVLQSDRCPESLIGMTVFSLDVNKLISGTTYRGDLEQRLDIVVTELKKYPRTIVFIDEIQSLFNKSNTENSSGSIQNILKPYLTENSKFIGCATEKDYKTIESDKAFERRFSVVHVSELSHLAAVETLCGMLDKYEKFYDIKIDESLCEDIVRLCTLYIKNRYLPDKAFDALDIACVFCKNRHGDSLSIEDIRQSVSKLSGIDSSGYSIDRVSRAKENMKSVVFGQDNAIDSVCKSFTKYYLGVNDKTKPIGNYLFVGPTGTGKTEVCKQLAKNFFTDESFIRYDMSEFMDSHTVSKIIGSPPGYVGYNAGGTLTERIKHNPFSIILFDEVEKAHPDVINILLQIMDDGRLTDSFGDTINFCNCLIVMTSNLGCKDYLEKNTIGFAQSSSRDSSVITDAVNKFFSPEFRNRLDGIIYFNNITDSIFDSVFDRELNMYLDTYQNECCLTITLDDTTKESIKNICRDEKNGVRFIRRRINELLDDVIIHAIESGESNIIINYDINNNKCFVNTANVCNTI